MSGFKEIDLKTLREHGAEAVKENLPAWLEETSAMGCGDDVTMAAACFLPDEDSIPGHPGPDADR